MTNLVSWNPFEEFDNFFRAGRTSQLTNSASRRWAPAVDISEYKDHYIIHAELPATKKDDISLRIEKGLLVLEGERRHKKREEGEQFHRVERSYGRFQRTFALPEGVDESHLKAEYIDGVLTITIQKIAPQVAKNIEIATS